ncbi:hypothetical protein F2Q69_00025716 [Brassica cretica]|uniref:Uncharacterized protein n=1 Tax=Brassica cretica TaxID=69181 RepID=A0A8S9RTI9_BRACR|nr:hypothetical protein F2Q69_00025716 [Brassica cretica]
MKEALCDFVDILRKMHQGQRICPDSTRPDSDTVATRSFRFRFRFRFTVIFFRHYWAQTLGSNMIPIAQKTYTIFTGSRLYVCHEVPMDKGMAVSSPPGESAPGLSLCCVWPVL